MAIARKYFERFALASALETYLTSLSLNTGEVKKGFQSEDDITVPMVSVYFLPSNYLEIQMGRSITADKSFIRRVQVDSYMETEPRADAIGDAIADFFDETVIQIKDDTGTLLGHLYCPDSVTINISTTPPVFKQAKILRWRSVVQATLEAHYLV